MSIDLPMLLAPLAQVVVGGSGYSLFNVAATVIVIGALAVIAILGLRWMGVNIPPQATQILGVVGIAIFLLIVIGLLLRFAGWA